MVAIYNKVNNKFVIYQSSNDFNPNMVNQLLSAQITNNKLYEEHTNEDFTKSGCKKNQTFDLRLDNDLEYPKTSQKKIWKIENKLVA